MCTHARILKVSHTDRFLPRAGSQVDGKTPYMLRRFTRTTRVLPGPSHAPGRGIYMSVLNYLSLRDTVLPDPEKHYCSFVSDIHQILARMEVVNEDTILQLGGNQAVQAWFDRLKAASQACVDACQASVKLNSTAPLTVLKKTVTSMSKPQLDLKDRPTPPAPWDIETQPALTKYKIPKAPKPAKSKEKPPSKAKAPKPERTESDRKKSKHRDKHKHVDHKDKHKPKDKPAVADPKDKFKPRNRRVIRDSPPRQRVHRPDIVRAKVSKGPTLEAVKPLEDSSSVYIRRGPRVRESRATKHGSPKSKSGSAADSVDRNNNRR